MLKECIDFYKVFEKSSLENNYNFKDSYLIDDDCKIVNTPAGLEIHLVFGRNNGEPDNSPNYESSSRTFILNIDLDEVVS